MIVLYIPQPTRVEEAEAVNRVPVAMNMTEEPLNTASVRQLYFTLPGVGYIRLLGYGWTGLIGPKHITYLPYGQEWWIGYNTAPSYHSGGKLEWNSCTEASRVCRELCSGSQPR